MSDSAVEQLQTKIAFLEHAIAELSDVVFSQHRDIQTLHTELRELRERVGAVLTTGASEAPDREGTAQPLQHERPPHY